MVGILVSSWDGLFSGAMLVSGGVYFLFTSSFWDGKYASQQTRDDNKDQPSSMGIRDIPRFLNISWVMV